MADGSGFLDFGQELVVDLFAGGGGASTGIARAYREPDVAVNHDRVAIAVHRANHPQTQHYQEDVFHVDPIAATGGKPVGLLWASPDCRHHSKAAGGKPRSKRVRGLAWVVVRWALLTKPRLIELENVEEFQHWGPLLNDDQPDPARKGETFRAFVAALSTGLAVDHPAMDEICEFLGTREYVSALVQGLGYTVDWREIRACDHGAPTIRKRLLIKARRDGVPITWAPQTHAEGGAGGLKPWRTAGECIDFATPGRSIFGRKRPLAENTLRRVARGLWRHVLATDKPYIVPAQPAAAFLTEHANASSQRTFSASEPLRTQVAQVKGGHFSVVGAYLVPRYGEREGQAARSRGCGVPMPVIVPTGNHGSLVAACFYAAAHGEGKPDGVKRWGPGCKSSHDPLNTITASGSGGHSVMQAHFLEQANGGFYDGDGRPCAAPMSTVCTSGANQRLVSAYLVKYYGNETGGHSLHEPMHTIPTKDRMGLVETVQVPASIIPAELLDRARQCAALLHRHLPEYFPEPVDLVLVGDHVLVDITLRMLDPPELARAQGFPPTYILDRGLFETAPGSGVFEWQPVTKTDQVRLIGNSVCPDMAASEVANDLASLIDLYTRIDLYARSA